MPKEKIYKIKYWYWDSLSQKKKVCKERIKAPSKKSAMSIFIWESRDKGIFYGEDYEIISVKRIDKK